MTVEDASAKLAKLLEVAAGTLRPLGDQPIAIASARHRFNDAWTDDYWCAVQMGDRIWEQSQFFSDQGQSRSNERGSLPIDEGKEGSPSALSVSFQTARALLRWLDTQQWHSLASAAFGTREHGAIAALVIQFDQVWFHMSHPNDGDAELHALIGDRLELLGGGIDDRFDHIVGGKELAYCTHPDPSVASRLSDRARRQFSLTIVDEEASIRLATILGQHARNVAELCGDGVSADEPFAWGVGNLPSPSWRKDGNPIDKYFPNQFVLGEVSFLQQNYDEVGRNPKRYRDGDAYVAEIDRRPFDALAILFRMVDAAHLRTLFERATGMDTFGLPNLVFIAIGGLPYILCRRRIYGVNEGGLYFIGMIDEIENDDLCGQREWLARLRQLFAHRLLTY